MTAKSNYDNIDVNSHDRHNPYNEQNIKRNNINYNKNFRISSILKRTKLIGARKLL